jgi:hypothetical protein
MVKYLERISGKDKLLHHYTLPFLLSLNKGRINPFVTLKNIPAAVGIFFYV